VNLIGEHTDYNGGLALPFALDRSTTAVVREREDDRVRVVSGQEAEPWEGPVEGLAEAEGWAAYVAGVLWALREEGWPVPGVDVEVDSTVPVGAGLSSSAALEVSVAVAVTGLLGRALTPGLRRTLVDVCRRAETEVAGAPTGGLDQMASLLCREGHALLIDFADLATRDVPLPLDEGDLAVLVIDTRVHHRHAGGGYADRRAESEAGDPRRLRHVTSENARVQQAVAALEERRWDELGRLMTASHASLRDDYEVSSPELDAAVEAALAAGALGARMTGGGFGGSAIALVERAAVGRTGASVRAAFGDQGFRAPDLLVAMPSGPAEIVG